VWDLTLTFDLAWPSANIMFPYGACNWARKGNWIMNVGNDPAQKGYGNVWPLLPFKSKAF
jgi:hypothetical protein